jgi:kynurenine formamidase
MKQTFIDLTHSFDEQTIYWPTEDGFIHEQEHFGKTDGGYFYSSYRLSCAEHGGTHMDAPIHFNEFGQKLDEISLTQLIGPGVVIDVGEQSRKNPDYLVSIEDIEAFEKRHNQSLTDTIVLLKTGYGDFWPDRKKYLGTDKRGDDALKDLHFPGLDPKAAFFLISKKNIKAIGIDTASIDHGQTKTYESHRHLAQFNIPIFENVAALDRLPAFNFQVIALPMKIKNGSGGPLRIVAIIK